MPILSRRTLSAKEAFWGVLKMKKAAIILCDYPLQLSLAMIVAYRRAESIFIALEILALPVELARVSHCHALLAAAIRFGLLGHSVIAFPSQCSVKLDRMEGAAAGVIKCILSIHLAVRRVGVTRNITPGVTFITFAAFALVIIVIGNAGLFTYVRDAALLALAAITNAGPSHWALMGLHGTLGWRGMCPPRDVDRDAEYHGSGHHETWARA